MQARDIMTREVLTVNPDMLVSDLDKFFLQNRISCVPVLSKDGKFLGLVTKGHLITYDFKARNRYHLPTAISLLNDFCNGNTKDLDDYLKKIVMKKVEDIYVRKEELFSAINEDTPLEDIVSLLLKKGISFLPVLQGDKLVGIIGRTDVLRAVCKINHESAG